MTIEEYVRAKEDLEVDILNSINMKVREFQEKTGTIVFDVEVTTYEPDSNRELQSTNRISDVTVMALLSQKGELS